MQRVGTHSISHYFNYILFVVNKGWCAWRNAPWGSLLPSTRCGYHGYAESSCQLVSIRIRIENRSEGKGIMNAPLGNAHNSKENKVYLRGSFPLWSISPRFVSPLPSTATANFQGHGDPEICAQISTTSTCLIGHYANDTKLRTDSFRCHSSYPKGERRLLK